MDKKSRIEEYMWDTYKAQIQRWEEGKESLFGLFYDAEITGYSIVTSKTDAPEFCVCKELEGKRLTPDGVVNNPGKSRQEQEEE